MRFIGPVRGCTRTSFSTSPRNSCLESPLHPSGQTISMSIACSTSTCLTRFDCKKRSREDMLAPFHYYGVTDFEKDGEVIGDTSQLRTLVAPERVAHLIQAIERYGHVGDPVRGLMFCSRKDEARRLSCFSTKKQVHGNQLRTRALTGEDSVETREGVVVQLENRELDYIITVDVFNEGIDIRTVNQVVMLPANSVEHYLHPAAGSRFAQSSRQRVISSLSTSSATTRTTSLCRLHSSGTAA